MERSEQREIATHLIDAIKNIVEERLERVPEDWDGHELRLWIRDIADEEISYIPMAQMRHREYKNTRLVNNI